LLALPFIEADEVWDSSIGVFLEDFDQAPNEKLLLFGGSGMPVVWLSYCDCESNVSGPFLLLLFCWCLGDEGGK
jgi:hypothetical protein